MPACPDCTCWHQALCQSAGSMSKRHLPTRPTGPSHKHPEQVGFGASAAMDAHAQLAEDFRSPEVMRAALIALGAHDHLPGQRGKARREALKALQVIAPWQSNPVPPPSARPPREGMLPAVPAGLLLATPQALLPEGTCVAIWTWICAHLSYPLCSPAPLPRLRPRATPRAAGVPHLPRGPQRAGAVQRLSGGGTGAV